MRTAAEYSCPRGKSIVGIASSKTQSLEKKKEAVARIRAMSSHVHSNGGYPAQKRVTLGLNTSEEVGTVLREIRRELSLIKRG